MIFLDIDGTLLDHEGGEALGGIAFFDAYRHELKGSSAEFLQQWYMLSEKYFEKFLAKQLSFQEQRRMRIKELFGHQLSDEQADARFNAYLYFYKENWSAFDDVIPCLKELKRNGFRLGIISNGDLEQQREKLEKIGVLDYVECIFTSSEIGVAKPNAAIFQKACESAKVSTEECYYVGDRLDTDAIGSTRAGMKGIWLNRHKEASPNQAAEEATSGAVKHGQSGGTSGAVTNGQPGGTSGDEFGGASVPKSIPVIRSLKELLPIVSENQ
ncbi:HAD family hydrolase [Evansella sp. AB-P1]|uniref:HAD family hydrolase n=1 Tax=Evansella sp. AB-P1 TaxID=3037653 RepID=UPI00241D0719|nr:HAD family hydrolase [Evansella sp. AB-P1]MDG5789232.1 HAD family hydrolase [Evansella sp. AB-P1]